MFNSSSTSGVIHPPQSLWRGNTLRSTMSTSSPESRSAQAQDDPAGPPPMIITSHASIVGRPSPRRMGHTGVRASRESTGSGCPQTGPGTIADCRRERKRSIRQDTAATCGRTPRRALDDRVELRLKPCQPVLEGLGVMLAQVFDVEHAVVLRFEDLHRLSERWAVSAGEDALPGPDAEGLRTIAADEMQKSAASVADGAMNHAAQLRVVLTPDMLQHANGGKHVELAVDIAVIVLDKFHSRSDTCFFRPLARPHDLFVRNVEGFHPDAVVLRHVDGQRA